MSTYGDSDAKPRLRTKIRVMPPAQTIKRLAHEAHFGKGSFNELVQSGPRYKVGRLSHGRRTNAVSSGGAGLTAQKAARSGSSASSLSSSTTSQRTWGKKHGTSSGHDTDASLKESGVSVPTGVVPVPVKIQDPRMLQWMNEFDDVERPQQKFIYRPTFLTYRKDDDERDAQDEAFTNELREGDHMSSHYAKARQAVPFHMTMIALNTFSFLNSFYLLYKFSELGRVYIENKGYSPLTAHKYLQFHIFLAGLITVFEVARRTYDVPFLSWILWSRASVFSTDFKAKLDDIKSLLFLLYCTWSVPGLTYEAIRFFGYDMRVASPFQAFFPLAFVSYAALAIVRPLRGLRYSRVSTNFNLMWKIPVYVSSGTLMLFYAFRGYAVPAIIMFLHTFVLAMTNYAYINVQVVNKFLVMLIQDAGFSIKILLLSFLNWSYLKYVRGLVECFNLYKEDGVDWAILRCADTASWNTFTHRLSIAFSNVAASVYASRSD